jgi:ribonucleoside-diphosphate reductase alpha chain
MTPAGWVEAKDLQSGDRIHILNRKGGFGAQGNLEEGRVLGWLVGDGTLNAIRAVLSFFGEEKRELAPLFAEAVTAIVEKPSQRRAYPVGVTQVSGRDEARVMSDRLGEWATAHGLAENKYIVPSAVMAGSEDMQRGFLQALFTADGQVNDGGEKGCSVRLSSSHLPLLKDVQRLLLNFGIVSRIYQNRRQAGMRPMPDGHGGHKDYFHLAQHDLAISKTNLLLFTSEIGFITQAKQARLSAYLDRQQRGPYRETFTARIENLILEGEELVFDLHQPDTHSFVANGIVVHNCGEQWLGPYENCCLGSVNLAQHFGPDHTVDWEKLRFNVELSTRFLDDVVEANAYVPAVPQLAESAHRARRIGLGIMGLGDLMYHHGIRYGSPEGQEFAAQVMEFVRYHAMRTSVELARERGAFPAIQGSIYDPDEMSWTPPVSVVEYQSDFGRPGVDWDAIVEGIRTNGIRNAAQTTVAPTGTIATVAGCEGYGCEPVFALAYIRHVNDNGKDLKLNYTSPQIEQALIEAGLSPTERDRVVAQIMETGTCQHVSGIPDSVKNTFVVSSDITAEEHVRMQAAMQAFVDNSLSKTVNFPAGATEENVATAYQLAWSLGCKGITVYVTGSRQVVVLETKATARQKEPAPAPAPDLAPQPEQKLIWHETKKPRPKRLPGYTFTISTPLGKAFVTINENGGEQPFEVFINSAKAGSDTAAVSEAIGRLVSYVLRLASPVSPRERLQEVVNQLNGIGGGRSMGFGPNRVRSLPDGVAHALAEYLEEVASRTAELQAKTGEEKHGNGFHQKAEQAARAEFREELNAGQQFMQIGDLCPECGQAAVVNEEGCRKCYACGFSEC